AVMLALLAWRGSGPRLAASVTLVAVVAQISLGIAIVLTSDGTRARHVVEILHVAGAGAVWATFVALAAVLGPPERGRVRVAGLASRSHAG
ncbi:MAG: hypothetical protein ACXWZT_11205, partial [Gaiellaceae bacterium]